MLIGWLSLEENGVATTCELITYEPEALEDIPLGRDALALKIIMKVCQSPGPMLLDIV